MRNAPYPTLLFTLSVLALAPLGRADDGFLTSGGAPRLLSRHPSIHMVRETVVVDVLPQGHRVEATFVFRNDGPACTVRMGFPDRGDGAEGTVFGEDTYAAKEKGKKPPVYTGLKDFASSVDGKPVGTTLIPDGDDAQSWHVKSVAFAKGQTRRIHVRYGADGGGATNSPGSLREADYILHTGASWKGPIGYASVLVRFAPGVIKGPIRLESVRRLSADSPYALKDLKQRPSGTVFWEGPTKPKVRKDSLLFVAHDLEPKKRDDVAVYFGFSHEFPNG